MRYPYEPLLTFLVSRNRPVNETLEGYQLPGLGDIWLAQKTAEVRLSAPPSLRKYMDDGGEMFGREAIIDWAREKGVFEFWDMQREFSGAFAPHLDLAYRIFSGLRTRTSMNLLLHSEATPDQVVEAFNEVEQMGVTLETLDYYERLFWDTRHMTEADWANLLRRIPTKQERHDLALALQRPDYQTVRDHLALQIDVSPEKILEQIAKRSFMEWQRAMEQPDPTKANVNYWQNAAQKAANDWDRVKRTNAEDEDVLKSGGFKSLFAVAPTKSRHPTVADLQGDISQPQRKLVD